MKKLRIFCFLILAASCSQPDAAPKDDTKSKQEEAAKKEKQEAAKRDSINKLLSAIEVKIFNHSDLWVCQGFCNNAVMGPSGAVKITEVKNFANEVNYKCKPANYILQLSIRGSFDGVDVEFFDNKNKSLFKEKLKIVDELSFSDEDWRFTQEGTIIKKKDANYRKWFEKAAKIQLSYEDSVFYNASWENSAHTLEDCH